MRENKAITLIALVITIVILLILGGVTISVALRNGGIFDTTKTAKTDLKISSVEEEINVELAELFVEDLGSATSQSKLIAELNKKGYIIKSLSSSPETLKDVLIKDSTGKNNDEINVVQGENRTVQIILDLETTEEKEYMEILPASMHLPADGVLLR